MRVRVRETQTEKEKKNKRDKCEKSEQQTLIPALNDFHSIHKFHVLLFVLDFGHDHCSRRGVKLEEKKTKVI